MLPKPLKFLLLPTIILSLLLSPFSLIIPTQTIQADSQITQPLIISENTTWTKQNSPYILTNPVYIEPQATLTIEPGVIIKASGQEAGFSIAGNLIAQGTDQEPIIFTSLYDPDYASSTNPHPPQHHTTLTFYHADYLNSHTYVTGVVKCAIPILYQNHKTS